MGKPQKFPNIINIVDELQKFSPLNVLSYMVRANHMFLQMAGNGSQPFLALHCGIADVYIYNIILHF